MSRKLTIIKVHCYQCNHDFPVNSFRPIKELICPYCDTEVNKDMLQRIMEAYGYVADLNHDFDKYHDEYNEPKFHVELVNEDVHLPFDDIEDKNQ